MNLVAWLIVVCEISFWVFIIAGLVTRYIFNQKKAGLLLLAMTPLVDVVLFIVTGIDIYRGAVPTIAHSIAPLYIAISIVYGKSMIRWADERFLYYVKREGPKPKRRIGMDYAKHSMKGSLQHVLAYMIGGAMLLFMIYYIGTDVDTTELWATLRVWGIIVIIDNAISISYFIWPRKA
ncbi:hypothetical protein BME96_05460 [Virgibacillus halodenitrificans]|uniref:Integral inner membrane protein n=1 Tax=Virgibacillus halodenitrificans TaxID=1482 RepID=A0AAC9IX10_VIRHA|nr:hypothetical protein [Virgibacillus halodenitrificans]APC47646.1 hypothetical protein BME96_05460 [Virgibacillus halodenitrificans]CDQ32483.1 hypothetical protein BN993_01899 [Virgibacillus halodenitrificans]